MSIYDSSTIGTAGNLIRFNDDSGTPYFRMRSRTPSRRELREFEAVLPEGSGVNDTTSFIGKMYMVLEGTMYPDDENGFHEGRETLRKLASLEVSQDDTDSDVGYVPYKWDENVGKQLFLKVMYADMSENTRFGIKQPFRLLCKIKYPVITSQDSKSVDLRLVDTVPGGGAAFPVQFPVMFGASSSQGQGSLTNDGDIGAWPSMVIYGPIQRPKITNVTTGQSIELDVNLASGSDTCIVNYDQDSLEISASNVNKYGKLTTDSVLFKIEPGQNDLTLTGQSIGSGAYATVSFNDSWPIS